MRVGVAVGVCGKIEKKYYISSVIPLTHVGASLSNQEKRRWKRTRHFMH
jgi:hypothetical protein